MKITKAYPFLASLLLIASLPVMAQSLMPGQDVSAPAQAPASEAPVVEQVGQGASGDIAPVSIPSLLFNYWEQTAIMEAKKSAESVGLTRGVTETEIQQAMNDPLDQELTRPPPESRNISLGGILFTSENEWTIWLNGSRVTPDALPEEVIDLRVYKHHIDMKWQDRYTRRLYPIRLRAHQRFNLDSRIFLPG